MTTITICLGTTMLTIKHHNVKTYYERCATTKSSREHHLPMKTLTSWYYWLIRAAGNPLLCADQLTLHIHLMVHYRSFEANATSRCNATRRTWWLADEANLLAHLISAAHENAIPTTFCQL
jgi:hypothetical protein